MFRVIDGVNTNILFSHHSIERFDRWGLQQCRMEIEDIMPAFYHETKEDGPLVWAVQDYIKTGESTNIVVRDISLNMSLVLSISYDILTDELNIIVITVLDSSNIRAYLGQTVLVVS